MRQNSLIPMLPVRSLAAAVAFYEQLGFVVEQRVDAWRWAMLRFDQSQLMLDESIHSHSGLPNSGVLYLYPTDIHAFHQQARNRGLDLPALETTFYGMTECRIHDPDGNRLWIGQESAAG